MSLNDGEPGVQGNLLSFFLREQEPRRESGNPAFGFPLFLAVVAGAVGMWESRSGDFQGLWETMGNLLLVFLVFHRPSFPQSSSPFASCCLPAPESGKQLLFFFLHPSCTCCVTLS